jgi:hypothetical protein
VLQLVDVRSGYGRSEVIHGVSRPTLRFCARSVPPTCTLQYVNAPTQTRTLADTGGLVVTDDGRRVLVFDRGTGALAVLAFVLGVLTLVVGGFGLVALVAGVPSRALGAAFLAVGLIIAAATYVVVRKIRHRRSRPLHECRPLAVIDRKLGIFSYGGGAVVSLDQVRSHAGCKSVRAHPNSSLSHPAVQRFSSAATRSTVESAM